MKSDATRSMWFFFKLKLLCWKSRKIGPYKVSDSSYRGCKILLYLSRLRRADSRWRRPWSLAASRGEDCSWTDGCSSRCSRTSTRPPEKTTTKTLITVSSNKRWASKYKFNWGPYNLTIQLCIWQLNKKERAV